ncbi:hypothetical protein AKJ09_00090 [Labilithrix luteola]|uniref:Uncharacterized protein n=1 Tax=Labilithrix luteola TaxID=1391654 RepID=A0A0K1PJ51_9BACT|nr:hypothetical protein AKJ09_00022 [Labilithrix luteola]AKU93426.1 hypothetical protein AKJ09_00090 [Labilithrix luteola]
MLCGPCGRNYDRTYERNATMFDALSWAANRARMFERRRRPTPKRSNEHG